MKIEKLTESISELLSNCNMSEKFSAVINQNHFAEVCAYQSKESWFAVLTIAQFNEGFDGVNNLVNFTENYTIKETLCVDLQKCDESSEVILSKLITHSIAKIGYIELGC